MKGIKGELLAMFILSLALSILATPTKQIALKEVKSWSFYKEPALYTSAGQLMMVSGEENPRQLTQYSVQSQEQKIISLPKGEGPGEFVVVKGVVVDDIHLYIWDPGRKRLSRFDLASGCFIDSQPYTRLFVLSKLLGINKQLPFFSVTLINRDSGKPEFRQQFEGLSIPDLPIVSCYRNPAQMYQMQTPMLLSSASASHLATAICSEYKITLSPLDGSKPVEIEQKQEPIPWSKTIQTLFELVSNEEENKAVSKYPRPKIIPPLQALAISQNHLAVCLNTLIGQDQALIHLYKMDGTFLGEAAVPALYCQFIFQFPMQHTMGFGLVDDHHLAALHYDYQQEEFVVRLYKIQL